MDDKKPNKYKRLFKNILMLVAGSFATRLLSFLLVPFYTAILSTSDYGTADLINTTVLLVLPACSLLMDEAVMRFTLDAENDRKQVFTIAVTISTIGFGFFLLLSPLSLLIKSLRPFYAFIVLYYVVSWIYNITSSFVRGMDKLAVVTTAGIIHTFAYLALNIYFLAIAKIGVYGYLLAINISNIVAILYLIVTCRLYKYFVLPTHLDKALVKGMVLYSIPMIPDYISWWINGASDKYVLTFFYGTALTGVYSIAYKIPSLLSQMTGIFSSAWKISSVENFGSQESLQFYNRIYSLYSGLIMIAAAVLILISKPLAYILFSNDFFEAWRITPFLIMAYCFNAMALYIGSIFTASKKTGKLFHSSMIGAGINLCVNFILIPKYQAIGAAIATIVGYIAIWLVNMINTREILRMDFNIKMILPASFLMLGEIIGVLMNCAQGYIITVLCGSIIILLNRKQIVEMIGALLNRFGNSFTKRKRKNRI